MKICPFAKKYWKRRQLKNEQVRRSSWFLLISPNPPANCYNRSISLICFGKFCRFVRNFYGMFRLIQFCRSCPPLVQAKPIRLWLIDTPSEVYKLYTALLHWFYTQVALTRMVSGILQTTHITYLLRLIDTPYMECIQKCTLCTLQFESVQSVQLYNSKEQETEDWKLKVDRLIIGGSGNRTSCAWSSPKICTG